MLIGSVFDKKASKFNGLMLDINAATLLRTLGAECSNPKSALNKFPEDYEFVKLGEFDEITGQIKVEKSPVVLGRPTDYIKPIGYDKPTEQN